MRNRVMNFIGKANYTGDLGTYIWGNNIYGKTELIAMIEGYREIQNLCTTVSEANEFQDEMGRFIAEAINEKIERDFAKVNRILIIDIDMSTRLLNCLRNADINYLDELSEFTLYKISRFRFIGIKSLSELQEIMSKNNVKFKQ